MDSELRCPYTSAAESRDLTLLLIPRTERTYLLLVSYLLLSPPVNGVSIVMQQQIEEDVSERRASCQVGVGGTQGGQVRWLP